ncbi:E3 ubiquitin-protein ligase TRIM56-like [Littorina saxatilis]|uniref:E3 ubiquitin-protein ligase TRIM56-like n=1 Tax=Littorina saxatilis TaxID=31220 RepID=UPI0038B5DE46
MATASVPVEPEDLDCSVCHELLSDPKLLPCGHCLCRHCLLSWLHSQRPALCPLCRCAIVVDADEQGQTSMEEIADGLPMDLAIAALVEARRLLERDHKCCVCEDVAATSLCLHCGDMLCAACTQVHGKLSATRQHKVESLASVTADTVAANRPVPCAVHADKATEFFCSTHGQTICHVCATSRHRGCSEVRDLEEVVGEAHALLAQLADTLRAGERELDRSIQQLDDHLKEVEKQSAAAIAHIDAMCQRLAQSVEACRRRLTEMTHSACCDVREAVSEAKTCLLQRRGKLTTHTRVVERVQDAKGRHTVTSMTPKLKTRVDDLDDSVTLPADAKVISKVTLVIDPEVVSRLEKELLELGQVKVTPTDIIALVKPQPEVFRFHDNHGKNIVLSNDQLTTERKSGTEGYGTVMSRDPMEINVVYEVLIDETDNTKRGNFTYLGAVCESPASVTLPYGSWLLTCGVVVYPDAVWIHGSMTYTNQFSALHDVTAGSRVGVGLDTDRYLHVFMDGKDLGVVPGAPSLTQHCYALFDLGYRFKKVTSLPPYRV